MDRGGDSTGDPVYVQTVSSARDGDYAEDVAWNPSRPAFSPLRTAIALLVGAVAVWVVAAILSGVHVKSFVGAVLVAAIFVGGLNAILPPVVAAVRLPFTLILGFVTMLAVDAGILLFISAVDPRPTSRSTRSARRWLRRS